MKNVFYLCGPTVSGKTALSFSLVQALPNIVLINADTMQMYKGLEPLAGHPTKKELNAFDHRLFSLFDLRDSINISKWYALICSEIEKVIDEGKLPFLIGGSRSFAAALAQSAYDLVLDVDQENAVTFKKEILPTFKYSLHSIILLPDIQDLNTRIWKCIRNNEKKALVAVENAINQDIKHNTPGYWTIGMKEYSDFINGVCSLQEAQERIFSKGTSYAKEQYSLFTQLATYGPVDRILTITNTNTSERLERVLSYLSDFM